MILDNLPKTPQAIAIRTGRNPIQLRDLDGTNQHCRPGTIITISTGTLAEIDPSDFTILRWLTPATITDHRAP